MFLLLPREEIVETGEEVLSINIHEMKILLRNLTPQTVSSQKLKQLKPSNQRQFLLLIFVYIDDSNNHKDQRCQVYDGRQIDK